MNTGDACPLPTPLTDTEPTVIARLRAARRIARVRLSDDPPRPSFAVSNYMQPHGYEILPVNPNCLMALGVRCFPSLDAIPGPIDLVNVFRRPLACADVTREAIRLGAKGIWLQSGIRNDEAKQ